MTIELLPDSFDALVGEAVEQFWSGRAAVPDRGQVRQGGNRDAVVSGRNMQGFVDLVRLVAAHCGVAEECVHTRRAKVVLPGYFRATKNWDVLVIQDGRLLAVFEFKSQVGSFGNNFNNRTEEVVGSAADLWVAHHHGAYGDGSAAIGYPVAEQGRPLLHPVLQSDPRPPFLAWLMLLEDCPASRVAVRCDEPHYPVFPEFRSASYARRYQILCERLVERQLYSAAALELTPSGSGQHQSLSPATSIRHLFAEFAGRLLAARY